MGVSFSGEPLFGWFPRETKKDQLEAPIKKDTPKSEKQQPGEQFSTKGPLASPLLVGVVFLLFFPLTDVAQGYNWFPHDWDTPI